MQDWTRMPVTGISENDMQVYLRWLDRSGRLRGARLCSEREWERTARGADDRSYPHGNTLRPEDANYDATYGRVPEAFGPDEVCSHARSTSPFGVCDMAGNVLELTKSDLQTGEFVIRGGGYYFFQASERSTNREPFLPNGRSAHVGFRVCADADELIGASWRAKPLSETR
jgi:formylglycine-generating enzyme required for sulfatase activity